MRMLSELVIGVADLVEAEGEAAKRNVARLGLFIILAAVAGSLALVAAGLLAAALVLALDEVMHIAAALAITGGVMLAATWGVALAARQGLHQ